MGGHGVSNLLFVVGARVRQVLQWVRTQLLRLLVKRLDIELEIVETFARLLRKQNNLICCRGDLLEWCLGLRAVHTSVALVDLQVFRLQELLLEHVDCGSPLRVGTIVRIYWLGMTVRFMYLCRRNHGNAVLILWVLLMHLYWLLLRLRNREFCVGGLVILALNQTLLLLLLLVLQLQQVVLLLLLEGEHLGRVQLLKLLFLLLLLNLDLLLAHRVQFFLLLRLENGGKDRRTVAG